MKIKLKSNYAGANLSAAAGSVIDLPEVEARQLVAAKYATFVDGAVLETTAVAGAPERAQRRPRMREVRA